MTRALVPVVLVAFALAAMGLGAVPAAVDSCSSLLGNGSLRSLPKTTITSATLVSGTFTPANGAPAIHDLPAFCRVTATLAPSAVSDVKVEVWMPAAGWNGKLQAVGNGGLAGTISYNALAPAIKSGYASASMDTGHVASDTTWLPIEDREKDYGFRAIHGMTVAAPRLSSGNFTGALPSALISTDVPQAADRDSERPSFIPRTSTESWPARPRIFPPACEPPSSPIFKQPRTVRRAISPRTLCL